MPDDPVLHVAFLWHQHQPLYKDPLSNRYELPWVRLHATKDYGDMVALLEEFPEIKVNINLVPSLMVQLEDYASGYPSDRFLDLSRKPAAELSFEDRFFLLENFFMANWEMMVFPHPRYRELLEKRGRFSWGKDLARIQGYFKEQDFRDLQVWFNLAWTDPLWRERDPDLRRWVEKGRNFTEEEKNSLLEKHREICASVLPIHKAAQDRGQIEITTSAFYHPILPLLIDTEIARTAMPKATLPLRFQHPEDAQQQIQKAAVYYQQRFGCPPQGFWPSEGSVSDALIPLLAQAGIRWIATDEEILFRSLPDSSSHDRSVLFQPYRVEPQEGKSVNIIFRDRGLSDAIGFVYASWDPKAAAQDFIKRLHEIRKTLAAHPERGPSLVSIILDGENCWEYYQEDGRPFLRELYGQLSKEPLMRTVRVGEFLEANSPRAALHHVWPGSWINANYSIWIGHPEDNLAWDLLGRTRHFLENHLQAHPELAQAPAAALAREEIAIAEGSDWCWWFGEDHSSANDAVFDYLFRKHLMNVYTLHSLPIPEELRVAIKTKEKRKLVRPPLDFITPKIDGRVTNYFEWQAAGVCQTAGGGGGGSAMHRAECLMTRIYFGYDLNNLYLRLDLAVPKEDPFLQKIAFQVIFLKPARHEATVKIPTPGQPILELIKRDPMDHILEQTTHPQVAHQKVIELAIPFTFLKTEKTTDIEFRISAQSEGGELERWPLESAIHFPYPTEDAFAYSWVV